MDEKKIEKDEFRAKMVTIKLLMSSLYARKQPYLIIDCRAKGTFYYTNIEHDRIGLYRPNMEDVLSKVTVTADHVLDAFYESFPAFKDLIAELDLKAFSTYLNKHLKTVKDQFPEITYDVKTRLVMMKVAIPDPTDDTKTMTQDMQVGIVLTDLDPSFYDEIWEKYEHFSDHKVRRQFRASESVDGDKVALEVIEMGADQDGDLPPCEFALPVKDGFSMPSVKEYCRRRELDPVYDVLLQINDAGRTAKAMIMYADDWLRSWTIMPGSLWFMSQLGL